MPPILHTERLLLTPLQLSDAPDIQRLFPQWEVVRYLDSHVPWPYPADGAECYVRDIVLPAMAQGRQWEWAIRLRTSPQALIGCIGLMDQPDNHRGFWLAPAWRGRGYMSEACAVVSRYWFHTLDRPVLRVPKAVGNQGSRRVSEREGMRLVGEAQGEFVCGTLRRELWELRREDWQQS
ncbi:acetyltransferase, including N-acetylaseof ribosomal protein [Pseudomonas sp. M47T1]|uniref:GNAT family N-acetyltransferase n=1 Tax=unclassified Pseudomonas TaxID=196821 RepID=UPI0002607DAA|nr:GNAT family N-acetyltransferase [Pseudomonas sp. M47T1]EIK95958.1 acetyltransferase, including N-acetylaseof ribosomal protein [Pseudomonas sp. M47T1]